MPRHAAGRRRRTGIGPRGLFGGAVALALVGAVAWMGLDALAARDAAAAAKVDVRALQDQVLAGDTAGANETLVDLQAHAHTAVQRTGGPLWSLAAAMPWVGDDVRAVRTVTGIVEDLATTALPSLMQATTLVDPATLAPVDGRVDLAPLVEAAPGVVAADDAVQDAVRTLAAIDTDGLVGPVASPVADLRTQISGVALTTATAARAVQLIPPMLGADGPREYLVLVQNNAEPRATGGIPGTVLHLRAADGAVEVLDQRSGGSLADLTEPVLPLTEAEDALFGPLLATDMRDVTFTPDFPRSGALAREIWLQKVGGTIDGVLSVDPGALAHVLGATGPVPLPDGSQLTAENVVATLLNTVYLTIAKPADQDVFFAATSGAVFDAVVSGQGEAAAVVEALAQSAREGRLMIWSAHSGEQALLAGTVLSGELRGADGDGDSAVIGVYLNDGTEAKMGYYLDLAVTGTSVECRADGSQQLQVDVTLTSRAPADAASLPPYLTGNGAVVPAGEIRTNVLIYAPVGGQIDEGRVNSDTGSLAQIHDDLGVQARTIQVKPGESVTVSLDISTGPGQLGDTAIRVTPTATVSGPVHIATTCG